jgi:transcriptional antiterminator NusG
MQVPLFPGYVFVRAGPIIKNKLYNIPGIIRLLGNKDGPSLISDSEIARIELLQSSNAGPVHLKDKFERGEHVKITSGPLMGLEGQLVVVKGGSRLLINIAWLEKMVAVDISPWQISKIK